MPEEGSSSPSVGYLDFRTLVALFLQVNGNNRIAVAFQTSKVTKETKTVKRFKKNETIVPLSNKQIFFFMFRSYLESIQKQSLPFEKTATITFESCINISCNFAIFLQLFYQFSQIFGVPLSIVIVSLNFRSCK